MNKIKKGDEVIIIAGKDKGKTGKIIGLVNSGAKFLIEGLNLVKKHVKADPNKGSTGGIVEKPMPIDRSNVMLLDPTTQKGSKVGIRTLEDGTRARFYKASDQLVDVK